MRCRRDERDTGMPARGFLDARLDGMPAQYIHHCLHIANHAQVNGQAEPAVAVVGRIERRLLNIEAIDHPRFRQYALAPFAAAQHRIVPTQLLEYFGGVGEVSLPM